MERYCFGAFFLVWLGILAFILFRFATRGMRGAGLGAKVVHEHVSFRAQSSAMVKTDVSVVTTSRRDAPIGLVFVQRGPMSIAASGANLTREHALTVATWLREAAGRARS
jgi:hypothetical protein